MKKLIVAISMVSVVLLLAGCSSTSTVTNLDAAAFSQETAKSGVITLDVRTPGEYMTGHIQGAINIDVESLQFDTEIAKLDKNATYAVYCRSGRRSVVAVDTMAKNGFTKLFNLTNGVIDWQISNLPLVTS
jgi:rhodanese-related sulfurtransferase